MGTNMISEIRLVGDGAGSILGIDEGDSNNQAASPVILYPNFPNPFRNSTKIRYYLHDPAFVSLIIFNHNGQEISRLANETVSSGEHVAEWIAGSFPAGTYYARLNVNGFKQVRKMNLVR